jgi:hypothetical protein
MRFLLCKAFLLVLFGQALVGSALASAALSLRERVNAVTLSDPAGVDPNPAAGEQAITLPKHIGTGENSRAHLEAGGAQLRIGANSVVQLDASGVTLERGSLVFEELKAESPLRIKIGGQEVSLEGETGFAYLVEGKDNQPGTLHVGAISGVTKGRVNGRKHRLRAGDVLTVSGDGKEQARQFDLAKQVKTSQLINGFKVPLQNHADVQREVRRFASLQTRGFVEPPQNRISDENSLGTESATPLLEARKGSSAGSKSAFVANETGHVGAATGFQSRFTWFAEGHVPSICGRKHACTVIAVTPPPTPRRLVHGRHGEVWRSH